MTYTTFTNNIIKETEELEVYKANVNIDVSFITNRVLKNNIDITKHLIILYYKDNEIKSRGKVAKKWSYLSLCNRFNLNKSSLVKLFNEYNQKSTTNKIVNETRSHLQELGLPPADTDVLQNILKELATETVMKAVNNIREGNHKSVTTHDYTEGANEQSVLTRSETISTIQPSQIVSLVKGLNLSFNEKNENFEKNEKDIFSLRDKATKIAYQRYIEGNCTEIDMMILKQDMQANAKLMQSLAKEVLSDNQEEAE